MDCHVISASGKRMAYPLHRYCVGLILFISLMSGSLLLPPNAWAQKKGGGGPGTAKFNQAREAQRLKKWDEAIKLYDEAIGLEKTQYRYYFGKASCLVKLEPPKLDEAIQAYTEALKVNPGFTKAYAYIAQAYIKKKDYGKAIDNYNMAYDKEQDQAQKIVFKLQAVKLLSKINKNDEALKELQTLKSLAPDDLRILQTEGDVYGQAGQWEQSLQAYEKAVQKARSLSMQPQDVAPYLHGQGLAYYRLNKNAEFTKILEDLKTSSPTWHKRLLRNAKGGGSTKQILLATAYFKADEFEEALKYVKQAIEKKDNLALAYKVEGMIYMRQGKNQQAITSFSQSADNEKDEKKLDKIYNLLIGLQFRNAMYQEALTTANNILQKSKNNANVASVKYLKAQAEYKLGKYGESIATLDDAIKAMEASTPPLKKAKYYFTLGLAAKKSGNKPRAQEAFKNALYKPFKVAAQEELNQLKAP